MPDTQWVVIRSGTELGNGVEIDANASIGVAGFERGFTREDLDPWLPLGGRVQLGDSVFVGANTIVGRAQMRDTVIGAGSKIDALVYVGHGVRIGQWCRIAGQAGFSGNTVVEDDVIIGGQVGTADGTRIGKKAFVLSRSGVVSSVGEGQKVGGFPALPERQWKRQVVLLRQLPELWKKLRQRL